MNSIFITGTSSGIGKYLAENLSRSNKVFGVSRSKSESAEFTHFEGDLMNAEFLEKISEEIEPVDFLIINAGIGFFGKFTDIEEQNHTNTLELNLVSPMHLIYKLLKKEKIQKGIICIGSYAGKKSMKYGASYMASKFGLRGFAMGLKNELSLSVQIINPKIVETNFHKENYTDISALPRTEKKEILEVIENIIAGNEKRFEIDI